jgi:hypothetical protein
MSTDDDPTHPPLPLSVPLPPNDIKSMDAWNVIMVEGHVMWMTRQSKASILQSCKYAIQSNTYISLIKVIGVA